MVKPALKRDYNFQISNSLPDDWKANQLCLLMYWMVPAGEREPMIGGGFRSAYANPSRATHQGYTRMPLAIDQSTIPRILAGRARENDQLNLPHMPELELVPVQEQSEGNALVLPLMHLCHGQYQFAKPKFSKLSRCVAAGRRSCAF